MTINENLARLKKEIPGHIRIVAVSKTHHASEIMEVYDTGHRLFGENRAQELIDKQPFLPSDIQWHFIGHLQTNKVKYIAPYISMIQSIDSLKLLTEVNKQAQKYNRMIDCLLQFYIAQEESKFGFDRKEALALLNSQEYKGMKNIRIKGVMGMATFTENLNQVRGEFRLLREIFQYLKSNIFTGDDEFCELSMGMSGDYQIAVQEGSTIVRIGTAIFGERTVA